MDRHMDLAGVFSCEPTGAAREVTGIWTFGIVHRSISRISGRDWVRRLTLSVIVGGVGRCVHRVRCKGVA